MTLQETVDLVADGIRAAYAKDQGSDGGETALAEGEATEGKATEYAPIGVVVHYVGEALRPHLSADAFHAWRRRCLGDAAALATVVEDKPRDTSQDCC